MDNIKVEKYTPSERKAIGTRLRFVRQCAGLTQPEMAKILGISASFYSKIEAGEKALSANVLLRIEGEFSTGRGWILHGEGVAPSPVSNAVYPEPKEVAMLMRETTQRALAAFPHMDPEPDETRQTLSSAIRTIAQQLEVPVEKVASVVGRILLDKNNASAE